MQPDPPWQTWSRSLCEDVLERFERLKSHLKLQAIDLTAQTGHSSNDHFPLRAYLSIFRHAQGDEITISVDAHMKTDRITVSSDICLSDGTIVAEGPAFVVGAMSLPAENETGYWLLQFDAFLETHRDRIVQLGRALS